WQGRTPVPTGRERKTCGPSSKICLRWERAGRAAPGVMVGKDHAGAANSREFQSGGGAAFFPPPCGEGGTLRAQRTRRVGADPPPGSPRSPCLPARERDHPAALGKL